MGNSTILMVGGGALHADAAPVLWRRGFLLLGAMLTLLGLVASANLMVATFASLLLLGSLMLIGGIAHIMHAFAVRGWSAFGTWFLSGLFYLAAAGGLIYDPGLAASVLTLLVAAGLFLSGILRVTIGTLDCEVSGSWWIAASGVLRLLVSVSIALGWPANSSWVLGLFLTVDLLFEGVALLMIGFALPSADRLEGVLL